MPQVHPDLCQVFKQLSARVCRSDVELRNRKLVLIVAYAPTLTKSEKHPDIREEFYQQLDSEINKVSNRHVLLVVGDFNAKTGSGWRDFPEVVGHFGKGHVNSNGQQLLECMKTNDMILTNTLFRHKLSQVTTWEAPERTLNSNKKTLLGPDGHPRRNPFRNQIDYIAIKSEFRRFVIDSKSSSNFTTETDHRMVKMKF